MCINMHSESHLSTTAEDNIYSLSYFCFCGLSQ